MEGGKATMRRCEVCDGDDGDEGNEWGMCSVREGIDRRMRRSTPPLTSLYPPSPTGISSRPTTVDTVRSTAHKLLASNEAGEHPTHPLLASPSATLLASDAGQIVMTWPPQLPPCAPPPSRPTTPATRHGLRVPRRWRSFLRTPGPTTARTAVVTSTTYARSRSTTRAALAPPSLFTLPSSRPPPRTIEEQHFSCTLAHHHLRRHAEHCILHIHNSISTTATVAPAREPTTTALQPPVSMPCPRTSPMLGPRLQAAYYPLEEAWPRRLALEPLHELRQKRSIVLSGSRASPTPTISFRRSRSAMSARQRWCAGWAGQNTMILHLGRLRAGRR
ncbi:hypothetical protein DFP72DRAFT_192984 [Ephemerocybe angulata]|uniref:Uncharacterized protein n=1 Tax=Ephemerocybe angulata TaxID=980116 RepID=A0A8H6I5M2_9AGAR|nr:hypothetical protein DFP72DRAFT_192984 [Tulosesus angulatus]